MRGRKSESEGEREGGRTRKDTCVLCVFMRIRALDLNSAAKNIARLRVRAWADEARLRADERRQKWKFSGRRAYL